MHFTKHVGFSLLSKIHLSFIYISQFIFPFKNIISRIFFLYTKAQIVFVIIFKKSCTLLIIFNFFFLKNNLTNRIFLNMMTWHDEHFSELQTILDCVIILKTFKKIFKKKMRQVYFIYLNIFLGKINWNFIKSNFVCKHFLVFKGYLYQPLNIVWIYSFGFHIEKIWNIVRNIEHVKRKDFCF